MTGAKSYSRSSGTSNRILLLLVFLFVLSTVAVSVMLALTVHKIHEDYEKDSSTHGNAAMVASPTVKPTAPCPTPGTPPQPQEADVCVTEGCVLAAARIKRNIDSSIDPCDDFFQFSCGSWLKSHVIPEDKSSYGTFSKLVDDVAIKLKGLLEEESKHSEPDSIHKAKEFYKACVDTERIEQLGTDGLLEYIESLGGWPTLGSNRGGKWNEVKFNLEELMILISNETNGLPIAPISIYQDFKNPVKYIVTMDQTEFGMPSREYYLKDRNGTTLLAYETMLIDLAVALGADEGTAEQDAKDIVDFERELAKIALPMVARRNIEKLYNIMKVGDLHENFTGVDWMKLVRGVFGNVQIPIDENEVIDVAVPSYFENLGDILAKQSNRTLANYLIGSIIRSKMSFLPATIRQIRQVYQEAITGSASQTPRWQFCGEYVMNAMQQVVGRLFAAKYFTKEAKEDVEVMIRHLRESFKGMITELSWMEDATKFFAKEKVNYLEPRIGYPDWIYNNTKLNADFEQVTVDKNNALRSLISFDKAAVQTLLRKLRQNYDRSRWIMSPAQVDAYNDPFSNQITFPAGILQIPFYSKDQPASLNYGGIGHVIGHEITRGFDDQGRKFDKVGNLNSWWTTTDDRKFGEKAQCMIDQYSGYVVPGTGNLTINGANTIGENIADNGGSKESFRAYQRWVAMNGEEPKLPGLSYTGSQLFFINEAQVWCSDFRNQEKIRQIRINPHSLGPYRVYGPLQNSEDFAKAFNCRAGSRMNPDKKCAVW